MLPSNPPVLHTGEDQARPRPGRAQTPESRTVPWAILVSVWAGGTEVLHCSWSLAGGRTQTTNIVNIISENILNYDQ